jgi:hypothetical protein
VAKTDSRHGTAPHRNRPEQPSEVLAEYLQTPAKTHVQQKVQKSG